MRNTFRWMATGAAAVVLAVAVASPAQAAPVLRARWNMDQVPAMVDSSTDGVDNSGTTSRITMSNGFYAFNGTTSIATVPHKTNLNPGTATTKVEVRLNTATPPARNETYDIVRKGTSTTAGGYYKIEFKGTSSGMNAACIFKDKNRVVGQAIAPIPSKTWLTITCTKTISAVTLAVNGTTKKTTGTSVGTISNTAPVHIGGKGDGTDVFSGLMDFASISIG